MKRYTIESWGRYINCQGPTIVTEAESLRAAIRFVRKHKLTYAWSLSLKKVEDIPQVRALRPYMV